MPTLASATNGHLQEGADKSLKGTDISNTYGLKLDPKEIVRLQRERDLTSGQEPPLFNELVPFSEWPDYIDGPTVWTKDQLEDSPDKWQYPLTDEDIEDLLQAADRFLANGNKLTDISKEEFRLGPHLTQKLAELKKDLIDGKGFTLFKNHPTTLTSDWSLEKIAVSYMGIGSHLGEFLSQNGKGHILGHVKDLGNDPTQIHKVRIYSTNARQFFHRDAADIIGLLCLHRAKEGGESDIVSAHHVYNVLRKERPDILETLATPNWYFDRKGEKTEGQDPYIRCSAFYYYKGKVTLEWDPYFVRSLTRFWDSGELPPLSPLQAEAVDVLEATAAREALHMILQVGDIQFVSGKHLLHARTAFVDHPPPAPKRQLMRLWLGVSEENGGWPVPFADSKDKRRGGVQVGLQPHTSPLEAE